MRLPNLQGFSRIPSRKENDMKLRMMLTRMIPVLSDALETGSYRDGLRVQALEWASKVGHAAMREGRDASDAIMALTALGGAKDFEMQQLGLTASLGMCDHLLSVEAGNTPPDFEPTSPDRMVSDILDDIASSTRQACNVFTIPSDQRSEMIAIGAELEKAVSRDVAAGTRTDGDLKIARSIHEGVAEVATCLIGRRNDEAERTLEAVARLAA